MPELLEYNFERPELLDDDRELKERREDIDAVHKYYNGRQHRNLKVKDGMADDNFVINVSRKAIDQAVSMLVGDLPDFEVGEKDTPETTTLKELLKFNRYEVLLHNIATSGAISGHVFVKLVLEDTRVRWILLNPRIVSVFWRPDDKDDVVCYKIQWAVGETEERQDIVRLDNGTWLIRDLKRSRVAQWAVVKEEVWPYEWPPIHDWQNMPNPDDYYGEADLWNLILNDKVNFVASNVLKIVRLHGHPKTIGTGVEPGDVQDTSVESFWAISDPNAKITNLEMQSDLSAAQAFLSTLQSWFFAEHRQVDMSSVRDRLGQITNFGLQTLFKDALDKLETKRRLYGPGLINVINHSFELMGIVVDCTIGWGDPLPFNDKEEIEAIQIEMGLGIMSKETATELRGRVFATEQERIANENSGAGSLPELLARSLNAAKLTDPGASQGLPDTTDLLS